jgi:amidase
MTESNDNRSPAPAAPEDTIGAFVPHGLVGVAGGGAGPLAGRTFAVKDLYDVAGQRTGGGSPEWLEDHAPAETTAPVVTRLLEAGADLIGRTICDEFFYSLSGANAHYGTPVNVRAAGRLPGGSSSGSAAAVAAGLCDFALGSDTGGSVRVPAAFCGSFGLRPTHGRVELDRGMAMAPSFDTAGWFANDAELFRAIGHVLLVGEPAEASVSALLLAEDCFAQADSELAAVLRGFLERAGARLPAAAPATVAPDGFDDWRECFRLIQGHEIWRTYGAWIEANRPALGPGIKERFAFAATVSDSDAADATRLRETVRARLHGMLPPGTVMCLPTAPCIAPSTSLDAAELDAFRTRGMALTCIAGLSGLPQVTLPVGTVGGCPVGLSFIGWPGGDEALLDLAVALDPFRAP